MLKYKVIENFIDEDKCSDLVNDAEAILTTNSEREILNNNRQSIFSTGIIFNELLTKSKNWKDLNEKLYSRKFYLESLKELNLNENEFETTNFFFKKVLNNVEKKYKDLSNKKFSYLKTGTLSKLLIIRIYKELLFKVKFIFKKKINLELIYDFSISQKGYKREIHRDSDSRIIVFLLYLNSFQKNDKGGNLNLHELKNKTVDYLPAQPKSQECNLVKSFTPKAGRLVLFLNSSDAFHSVSEMLGDEKRYFLYGSYTSLNKENPFIKKSADKLNTDFFLLH
jgi:Rps23 Pro-64 3,4-dihydroxylase Tpa1-like proline 4-hydroxylase